MPRTVSWVLQALLILLGILSLLAFTRDGFHFFFHEWLTWLVQLSESILTEILGFPPIQEAINLVLTALQDVLARFGIELSITLQPHWKQAFVLLSLGLGGYAQATSDWVGAPVRSYVRIGAAVLCALAAAIMTGTVHLAHPSVLLWPLAGVALFFALDPGRAAVLRRIMALALATGLSAFALSFPQTMIARFGESTPSPGLLALGLLVLVAAVGAVLSGLMRPAADGESIMNRPGSRFGLRVLATVSAAAVLAGLGQWALTLSAGGGAAPAEAGTVFRDCPDCPDMVVIPGGSFVMGTDDAQMADLKALGLTYKDWADETPAQPVTVPAFALGKTEITVAQFRAFVEQSGYRPSGICFGFDGTKFVFQEKGNWEVPPSFSNGYQTSDHPVTCVTWWDAQAYVRWLSLKTGALYRLPSEAEWEYAARAGNAGISPWAANDAFACNSANGFDLAAEKAISQSAVWALPCDDRHSYTAPVASFRPNAFKLHDMHGNVWEWCEDTWHMSYAQPGRPDDGRPWVEGGLEDLRMLRGGSWSDDLLQLRSANRSWNVPGSRNDNNGFRLAKTF